MDFLVVSDHWNTLEVYRFNVDDPVVTGTAAGNNGLSMLRKGTTRVYSVHS